jgi:PD-(D/E)XK nuclease superfamily
MINNLQRLTNLIDFLKIHKVTIPSANKSISLKKIGDLSIELELKRRKFLRENFKELKQKIKGNYNKLRISALRLMEYDWNENSHSNILEYLIDYNSFEVGAQILCQMIKDSSTSKKDDLCKKVSKQTYTIDREYKIPSGRIDLFILDNEEKFVIIVENKIFAKIGEASEEDENSIPVTQLEKYEKWCNDNYADYSRLYILLNFSNDDDDTSLFEKTSYKQLYDNLKNFESADNIFAEYLLLLDAMLNPLTQDLFKIKKLANKIIENEQPDNPEMSLTDYYTLKTIFYAK